MSTVEADPIDDFVKKGYLFKKGGERRNWTYRFFVLKQGLILEYHKDHKVCSPLYQVICFFIYAILIVSIICKYYTVFLKTIISTEPQETKRSNFSQRL